MNKALCVAFFLIASFYLASPPDALSAGYNAGFRTIGEWSEEDKNRMDLMIWYPTAKGEREITISPWTVYGAPNAKCVGGKFPLLVISHLTPGNRFSHRELAAFFARRGYIVVVPTHPRDNLDNMDDLYTWNQLLRRAENIDRAIGLAANYPEIKGALDLTKIGFIGFGAGGATGLLLGGAIPNCASWQTYCHRAGRNDIYCQKWAKERIDQMCLALPLEEKVANPRIRAMALVAPSYGMMFDKYSFENYSPETLLIGATRDKINSTKSHSEPLARALGKKAFYYEIKDADLGALMSRCPSILELEMPDLCLSVPPETRQKFLQELYSTLAVFFERYLPSGA